MKELSIEEKAKRYDEALERAKQFSEKPYLEDSKGIVEYIFPELKEGEDERIRKEILNYIIKGSESLYDVQQYGKERFEKWIAWLEKQGEQKSVECIKDEALSKLLNKVICRFINNPDIPYSERDEVSVKLIPYVEMLENQSEQKSIDKVEQKPADKVEPKFKVGDKIVEDNEFGMVGGEITDIDDTHYELDGGGRYIPISHQDNYKLVEEQKPSWSEEDESMRIKCIGIFETYCAEDASRLITWFKSLKYRYTWKPSEEQMDALETAVSSLQSTALESLYQDLKRL